VLTALDVAAMPRAELEARIARGEAPAPEDLAGSIFFGVSLGLAPIVERLTWKTFAKAFVRAEGAEVEGVNVRVEQRGVEGPLVLRRRRDGSPLTFGPFLVRASSGSLVLDYGARAPWGSPLALCRDPLVAVNAGSRDLLLGTTRLALFGREKATASYFTLERRGPWPSRDETPPVTCVRPR
jgi:hypothetical protein